jgi:hypothetical protein
MPARSETTRKTVTVQPETRYARSGDVSIAYQVLGDAPLDLVWIPSLTHHVELNWENPIVAQFLRRLASVARVLVFDKRGTGMSDRLAGTETLEERMDDIRAVMDAAGSERALISGLGDGGPLAMLFAATYPERTRALPDQHIAALRQESGTPMASDTCRTGTALRGDSATLGVIRITTSRCLGEALRASPRRSDEPSGVSSGSVRVPAPWPRTCARISTWTSVMCFR